MVPFGGTIDDWGSLVTSGACADVLVIAPGGAYRPWPGEFLAVLPGNLAARTKFLLWDSSRAKTKTAARERDDFLTHEGPRVLVVNVEALSTVKARALCVCSGKAATRQEHVRR